MLNYNYGEKSYCLFNKLVWILFRWKRMAWTKDVEEDSKAREELLEKMGGEFRGVPVTDVNGEIVLGFDRARLSKLLDIKRF